MNYKTTVLIDDNPTTLFYNQDVVLDFDPRTEIMTYENPDDFINDYNNKFIRQDEAVLILLDINMPQKLGYELLEELEESHDNIDNLHVIMLTSSNLSSDIEKSSRFSNVIGYIEKPLTLEKLTKTIKGEPY